jgi:hypothetical protein
LKGDILMIVFTNDWKYWKTNYIDWFLLNFWTSDEEIEFDFALFGFGVEIWINRM